MTRPQIAVGTVRDDGRVFLRYDTRGYPTWLNPQSYHRQRVGTAMRVASSRARTKNLPFNLTIDHLLSIYPADGKCPVLGIPLKRGDDGGRCNSPSLDRIKPERGYVRDNVIWVSRLANSIKSCASVEQIGAVHKFYKDLLH